MLVISSVFLTWRPSILVTSVKISSVFWTKYFPGCSPATHHNQHLPEGKPSCCWAGCKSSYWQMQLSHVANTQQALELQNTDNENLFIWTSLVPTRKFSFLNPCNTKERLRKQIWHHQANLGFRILNYFWSWSNYLSSPCLVFLFVKLGLWPGALGKPRGSGWRGRWEGGLGWGTHVNPWLFHFNVWQNSLQKKKKKLGLCPKHWIVK